MTQAVRYFTEVLPDGHIPLPLEMDREKIRPGSRVEVILMLEDESQQELKALLASFRREADGSSEREVTEIADEAVAAVSKVEAGD